MGVTKHDRIAKDIAKKKKAQYRSDVGVDIVTPEKAIEVEVDINTLSEGIRQLQGHRQARYVAVPNDLVDEAKERTKGLKVGVMDENGKIRKRAK